MNIEILSCGSEKTRAISIVRKATGWGLKEAKDFVDRIEFGSQILNNVAPDVLVELQGIGASVREMHDDDEFSKAVNDEVSLTQLAESESVDTTEKKMSIQSGDDIDKEETKYTPIVASNMIARLDRESTMRVLVEVGKIAKESEDYDIEIAQLVKVKNAETQKAEELRKKVSKGAKTIIWLVTIGAALVGLVGGPLCIVTGLAALIIMNLTVKKSDLRKHEAENNAIADKYLAENVTPIQTRLDEIYALRDELLNNGKKDWAIDVVGKDLFYSTCVQDLYNLIKSRRADNLKEALNKYDDTQYKARMEEMQASIQNASEISAREAVKQTAYSQEIAKNTHQAATAAKATAYNTRQIDKNTRKFR